LTRALRALVRALGAALLFTVGIAVAAALSLRLPFVRRLVAANVDQALASTFAGRITIDRVDRLGLRCVEGVDAHIDDPQGRAVLRVEGLRGCVSTWTLLRTLVSPRSEIVVDASDLSVARAEATLDPDDSGRLWIARAFELRPHTSPGSAPRRVRVRLDPVLLNHATVHVQTNVVPTLDANIDGAEASMTFADGKVAVDLAGASLTVRGLPGGVQALGHVEAHLTEPALRIRALWNGAVGAIRDQADMTYDDGHIDAVLDVASATPEQMRAVWPGCPISGVTEAHVEAHGILPRLDVSARAMVGAGTIDVTGPVVIGPNVQGAVHVETKDFDAHLIFPSAPPSRLTLSGDVSVRVEPTGALESRGTIVLASGGSLGSARLPPAKLAGELARAATGEPSADVEIAVREPGAPTVVKAQLATRRGVSVVTFDASSAMARLEDVPLLGRNVTGAANGRAIGTIDLGTSTLDAHLTATATRLTSHGTTVDGAHIEAHATGNVTSPSFDIDIESEGLELRALHLSSLRGHARLTVEGGANLRDVDLDAAGSAGPAHVHANLVRISDNSLRVDDALVEGLGTPLTATLRVSPSGIVVQAKSPGVDLARVATFGSSPVQRGILSLDVDGTVSAGSADGRLAIAVQHAAFRGVDDANAQIEVTLHGRHASGRATASIEDIGTLEVHSSSVDIREGRLLAASSWRQAWGAIEFQAHVDLAKLASRLPKQALPFAEVTGALDVKGQVARDSADDPTPDVALAIQTKGLVLARPGGPTAWRIEGVDPTVHVTVDGDNGDTALQAELRDGTGILATIAAHSSSVPYAVLFSDQSPIDALATMPFDAHLVVPSRRMDTLPRSFRVGDFGGDLQAKVSWLGAVTKPAIDVAATLIGGRGDPAVVARRMDLSLEAHYDGARVDAALGATTHGQEVLSATARLELRAKDILAGLAGADVPWRASASARVNRLPLQSITFLDDRQVRGNVSGQVALDGLHADARASADLTFDGLQVGGVACRSSVVKMTVDGHSFDASARLDQDSGFVEAKARTGTHWGTANMPVLDASQAMEASVSAKQFRAAFLLPFVSKHMTALDGRIDAQARVAVAPGGTPVQAQGTIALQGGTFQLTSFGGEFHDVSGKLTLTPDGIGRLEGFVARGTTGSIQAAATARFDGLSVASVRARLVVPAKDPLPLVFDGVQMGMLDGGFDVALDRTGYSRTIDVVIDVPAAHLQLPPGSSSLDVQALGDVQGVRVGIRRATAGFVETPLDGSSNDTADDVVERKSPIQIAMRLGDVRVNRGTDLDVHLEGQPTITMTDVTRVTGQIRMLSGTIDVRGKPFTIDHGAVTFLGSDASNPQVVLTASWAAPDGVTRVYADFVGPLKTGKVRLRSQPPKTQNEILALILFGTTDDQRGATGGASAQVSSVAAEAGGVATQPLNRALDNLGLGGGISTKIDTSQTNPRPEVEVQIARDISLQIAWVLGVPPPSLPDTTLVTLDWHFLRKWSLETTVGDAGTSILDLVWQHKY
jgi:translocation and assembly module TamB